MDRRVEVRMAVARRIEDRSMLLTGRFLGGIQVQALTL